MRIKGAIFDVDGTLLDTMPVWMGLGDRYIISQGRVPEQNLGEMLVGIGIEEGSLYLKNTYGLELTVRQICDGMRALAGEIYMKEARLKPGAVRMLEQMKGQGIGMTVATLTEEPLIHGVFGRLGIASFFDGIFTAGAVGARKDEPLIFLKAAERMGTLPEETCVLEDTLPALITAKKAGFYTIGVYDPASEKNWEKMQESADLCGKDLPDVWEKLKEML